MDDSSETISNLEIAHRQLERAIQIYLDSKDYISALTLSGAAEEVLGKILKDRGQQNWLDGTTKKALGYLGYGDCNIGSSEAIKHKKEIANLLNYFRNRVKHYNQEGRLTLDSKERAKEMIERAIFNYFQVTNRQTGIMDRFIEIEGGYGA